MIDTFNGALLLREQVLKNLRDSPRVVQQGFMVILLVGLLVGGVGGVQEAMGSLNPEQEIERMHLAYEKSLKQMAASSPNPEGRVVYGAFLENLGPGVDMLQQVTALPTPLPRPVVALLRGLGVLFSRPFEYLYGVLITVVFTHLAARWLGGTGTIQHMMGLGALSVAPHALDAIAFIPIIGSAGAMLSSIAWIWGLIILVVGTSVAHRLDYGRASFAVLFFPSIGVLLSALGCCGLSFLAVALGGAGV